MRKEILGWMFDGARHYIELPSKKIEAIQQELAQVMRCPSIPYKIFENIVGNSVIQILVYLPERAFVHHSTELSQKNQNECH